MAAYCLVYDLRHLQADCQEPGLAPEPYARQSSMGYLYLFTSGFVNDVMVTHNGDANEAYTQSDSPGAALRRNLMFTLVLPCSGVRNPVISTRGVWK